MSDFAGQVIIITGGAQGIGRAYVEAFVQDGCQVVIFDINDPSALIKELGGATVPPVGYIVDVTNQDQVQQAVNSVIRDFGRIDVLVNNAAFYEGLQLQQTSSCFTLDIALAADYSMYAPMNGQ